MALPEPLNPVFVGDPLPAALNEEREAINDLADEVQTKIPLPTGAMFGDLLRWNGEAWETTETRFLEGNGRPDGRVGAPVGTRYIDKTGANGAVEWVKRAGGDSNTGWLCLAGDTGPRNIADLIDRGNGTIYSAILVRSAQIVELHIDVRMPSNKTATWTAITLPVGFRPQYNRYGGLSDNKEGADTKGTLVAGAGGVTFYGVVSGKRDRYSGNWITSDAWPATLPGSAL